MKTKIFTIFAAHLLLTITSIAQVPQAMNYQAIVRDAGGNAILNTGTTGNFVGS